MHWQGIKIHVVIASLIIGLAAFLGAHFLYINLNFQQPLKKELENNNLVTSYQIIENKEEYKIVIYLDEHKDLNLMQTYRLIYNEVSKIMGDRPFIIELKDQPNTRLNKVYNQGQFAIHEAMVKGNFREMFDSLNHYADEAGIESSVFIDKYNVYWQMRDGSNYVYEVVPRGEFAGSMSFGAGIERGQDGA